MYCADNDASVMRAFAVEVPSFQELREALWGMIISNILSKDLGNSTGSRCNVNSDVHIVRFIPFGIGNINN